MQMLLFFVGRQSIGLRTDELDGERKKGGELSPDNRAWEMCFGPLQSKLRR